MNNPCKVQWHTLSNLDQVGLRRTVVLIINIILLFNCCFALPSESPEIPLAVKQIYNKPSSNTDPFRCYYVKDWKEYEVYYLIQEGLQNAISSRIFILYDRKKDKAWRVIEGKKRDLIFILYDGKKDKAQIAMESKNKKSYDKFIQQVINHGHLELYPARSHSNNTD